MKGLDWSNEPYVRLHKADTPAYRRLRWEAQTVYLALLRKLDRAGCMPLDGLMPFEAVAEMVGCPEEVAERALPKLLAAGFIEVSQSEGLLVDPHYLEREEAPMSDRLRQQEARARRRDRATMSQNVTKPSQNVTPASRIVTETSRGVTSRHAASRDVTGCHSYPSLPDLPSVPSVPTQPEEEEKSAASPLPTSPSKATSRPPKPRSSRVPADFVTACYAHYVAKRRAFYAKVEGYPANGGPAPAPLKPELRRVIAAAISRHDDHLISGELAEFVAQSRAWAAAGGLFYSPWHTARDKDNNAAEGGKRYLEPWRPWKPQRGKPDPVDGFADEFRRIEAQASLSDPTKLSTWEKDWRREFAAIEGGSKNE